MENYFKPTIKQLLSDFPTLLRPLHLAKECSLTGISSLKKVEKNHILFCSSITELNAAIEQKANLIITKESLIPEIRNTKYKTLNILTSSSLQESMAKIGQKYFSINNTNFSYSETSNIHPTAIVDKNAKLHPSITVGAYSIIEAHAEIHEKVQIGSHSIVSENCTVGAFTKIANHSFLGSSAKLGKHNQIGQQSCIEHHAQLQDHNNIHSQVLIGRESVIGNHCEIESHTTIGSDGFGYGSSKTGGHYKKVHFGNVIIKDNVQIGASVTIDRGTFGSTIIGEGTKMDNLCHIAHNVKIGKHCLITAGFTCAGSSTIGDHCVFGGQTGVTGHINICNNVQIMGRSVISGNVTQSGTYGGFPLQEVRKFRRTYAALTKLPDLIKKINKLLAKN